MVGIFPNGILHNNEKIETIFHFFKIGLLVLNILNIKGWNPDQLIYWSNGLWFLTNNWDEIKVVTSLGLMVHGVGGDDPMQAVLSNMLKVSEKACPQGFFCFGLVIWFPYIVRFSSGSGSGFSPEVNRWLANFQPNMGCCSPFWFGRWGDICRMHLSGLIGGVWPGMWWFVELKTGRGWGADRLRIAEKINAMQVFFLNFDFSIGLSLIRAALHPISMWFQKKCWKYRCTWHATHGLYYNTRRGGRRAR